MNEQTPLEEIRERIAEVLPGLKAAASAVGLEDHRRLLRDHAQRVRDSHAAGMKSMGAEPAPAPGDDMGDITITGDIQVGDGKQLQDVLREIRGNQAQAPMQQPQQPQQPASPGEPPAARQTAAAPMSWWKRAAIGTALAGLPAAGVIGGALAASRFVSQPQPVPDPPAVVKPVDTWIEYDVEKWIPPQG